MPRTFYVYILTNPNHTTLYTGVTGDLQRRVQTHKTKLHKNSFTAKYNCIKLVYYEEHPTAKQAIQREKQIKSGSRQNKLELVIKMNPSWQDLAAGWY